MPANSMTSIGQEIHQGPESDMIVGLPRLFEQVKKSLARPKTAARGHIAAGRNLNA